MDSKIIKKYGEGILSYRLRTSRQRARASYEGFEKRLIDLHKEEHLLFKQQRSLGWETLAIPYQKGWKRSFVLRDDVACSKNADFFTSILEKINSFQYDWRKDFKRKKRKLGKKIFVIKH